MTDRHFGLSLEAKAVEADADLWQSCLSLLAQEIPEQQFNTWIRPILAEFPPDQAKITLFVANRFKLDWIRSQYSRRHPEARRQTSSTHDVALLTSAHTESRATRTTRW